MKELINKFYKGKNVDSYELKRKNNPKWKFEEKALLSVLEIVKKKITTIIDAPVGTGRFIPIYESAISQVKGCGIDYSMDMLELARERINSNNFKVALKDIVRESLDSTVDLIVCYRFLNLIEWDLAGKVLLKLMNGSKKFLLFSIRLVDEKYDGKCYIEDKIFIHREKELEALIQNNGFQIVKVFQCKDEKPGIYNVIFCEREKQIIGCRLAKSNRLTYQWENLSHRGKVYQTANDKQSKFIRLVTSNTLVENYFPKINYINNDFIDAEWVEGDEPNARDIKSSIEILCKLHAVVNSHESGFDYVEDLIIPRFGGLCPVIGKEIHAEIVSRIIEGSKVFQKKVSHPDLCLRNIVKTQKGFVVIDNELLCYTRHYMIDILNLLLHCPSDQSVDHLKHYLYLEGLDAADLKRSKNYLNALWVARQAGSYLVLGKLDDALNVIYLYLNNKDILPFRLDGLE